MYPVINEIELEPESFNIELTKKEAKHRVLEIINNIIKDYEFMLTIGIDKEIIHVKGDPFALYTLLFELSKEQELFID